MSNVTSVTSGQILTIATRWDNYNATTSSYLQGNGTDTHNPDGSYLYAASVTSLNGAEIQNDGFVIINSGGLLSGSVSIYQNNDGNMVWSSTSTVNSGGFLLVNNGGESSYTIVSGTEYIASGGIAGNSWITDGGQQIVAPGGLTANLQVDNASREVVYGQTSDTFLDASATLTVENGGQAYTTDVNQANLTINSGGMASGTALVDSGTETVLSGGLENGAAVYAGGHLNISSGGTVSNATVYNDGVLSFSNGAIVSNTLVESGGVVSGLILSSGLLSYNNSQNVINGITVQSGAIYNLEVASGAALSGFVNSGQTLTIDHGAVTRNDLVFGKGYELISGTAIGSTLSSATEAVAVGGISSNTIINNGSVEIVSGAAFGSTVNSGGSLDIQSGTVSGGNVFSGGIISGLQLNSGVYQVSAGTLSYDGLIIHSGALVSLNVNGGSLSGFTVSSGQSEYVGGGVTSATTVNSGGSLVLYNSGQAINTLVNSGGSEVINSGTLVSGGSVVGGGAITGLELSAGTVHFNQGNGLIDGISLHSGAVVGLTVDAGAAVSGFIALGQSVNSSGTLSVRAVTENIDGSAYGTTLNNGGYEIIYSSGVASGSTVNSGGTEVVSGVAYAATVNSGGIESVQGGGISYAVTVNSGGLESVMAGGVISGSLINGGTVEINDYNGNSDVDTLKFIGNSGDLQLDTPNNFVGVISGFAAGDTIDLSKLNSLSTASLSGNNVLTVQETGGQSFTLQLDPKQNFSGDSFYFTPDSRGNGEDIRLFSGAPATISSVSYNAGSGTLSLTGNQFSIGVANGVFTVTDFSLSAGSSSYTLTSGSLISSQAVNSVLITLSAADQQAVAALFNQNGSLAYNGGHYSLSAAAGWDTGAAAISGQALNVSNAIAPTLSAVSYNAATGVLTVTGNDLLNGGSGLAVGDFKLSGNNGSYTLNTANDLLSNLSASGFTVSLGSSDAKTVQAFIDSNINSYTLSAVTGWDSGAAAIGNQPVTVSGVAPVINSVNYDAGTGILYLNGSDFSLSSSHYTVTDLSLKGAGGNAYSLKIGNVLTNLSTTSQLEIQLSATDQTAVAGLLNQDGNHAGDNSAYSLSAVSGWDSGKDTISSQPVTVTNLQPPTITTVSYNESTPETVGRSHIHVGVFTFTGTHLAAGVNLQDLTIRAGTGSYTFTSQDVISNLTSTGFTVTLGSTDYATVNALLSANGNNSTSGAAYNLSATANWDGTAAAISTQAVTVSGYQITVSNVAYNAATGILTLTGNSFTGNFANYQLSDLSLQTAGGSSYTLSNSSFVAAPPSADSVSIQVAGSDLSAVNALLSHNGGQISLSGATGWDANAPAFTSNITVNDAGLKTLVAGGLNDPQGIAVDSAGNVYIADSGDKAVKEVAAGGRLSSLVSSGLSNPEAIAAYNGNIYIADSGNNSLFEIASGSHSLSTLASGLQNLGAIAVNKGNLYFVENKAVMELAAGSHSPSTVLSSGLSAPAALAFDSNGDLFIADGSSIKELTAGSKTLTTLVSTGLSNPLGIVIDKAGNLYIADGGNNSIEEVAAGSHTVSAVLASGLNLPTGIAVDSSGNLYVTESGNSQIIELPHPSEVFKSSLTNYTPQTINMLWENTGQIELSKSVFTAFAHDSSVGSANFSNAAAPAGATDYLYYNAAGGGLYYDAQGSGNSAAAVEIAIIGSNSHPAALSVGDFSLIA